MNKNTNQYQYLVQKNCPSKQTWDGKRCVNKPTTSGNKNVPNLMSKSKQNGNKLVSGNKNGNKLVSGNKNGNKPISSSKPGKTCPSGQVKMMGVCVNGQKAVKGKCDKGYQLVQSNCIKKTNLSEYMRRRFYNDAAGGASAGTSTQFPGVKQEEMVPGKVYTTKDGKNYQVNSDGQSFSQCSSQPQHDELRGMFSSCIGRPSPASASLEQAINIANSRLTNLSQMQSIASSYLASHPQATYSQYAAMAPEMNRLTESEFNNIRNHMNNGPQLISQINRRPSISNSNDEHQPVIYSATSDFIDRNPGATYDEYKKKYGNGSLSREEYNAMRQKYGLPPI